MKCTRLCMKCIKKEVFQQISRKNLNFTLPRECDSEAPFPKSCMFDFQYVLQGTLFKIEAKVSKDLATMVD